MTFVPKSYEQVHAGLFWAYGKAANFDCFGCGAPAKHWCYMYTAGSEELADEQGRRYADNFDHYAPMCWRCHKKFDVSKDPRFREGMRENGRRMAASLTPAQRSLAGTTSMALRRSCLGCGLTSSPPGLSRHQRSSGHVGYTVPEPAVT